LHMNLLLLARLLNTTQFLTTCQVKEWGHKRMGSGFPYWRCWVTFHRRERGERRVL